MTSKSLFLADCIENFKRRNWVFWMQFLSFFICFPGALILGLNSTRARYENNPAVLDIHLAEFTKKVFHMNEWTSALIVGLAVLAGIQGFAWLQDKKQVNFYHSQPVSRNRRFLVIWINGVVGFLAAYLVNMALGIGAAAGYGCMSGELLAQVPHAILGHFLLFLSIYHVAIVAVMLTGNTLVSLMGTGVLLLYELSLRVLYHGYAGYFFRTYNGWERDKIFNTFLSPLVTFFRYQLNQDRGRYARLQYSYSETMFTMAGLVLFFGISGWLLYKNRPSESHGKSISFSKIKALLRILLLLLIGTAGGLFIYSISASSEVLGIGGAIFVTVIGHAVIQLIYEVDFRAIRKNLPGLGASILMVVVVFIIFRWDVFGYDQKIPEKDRVESLSLVLEERYWDGRRVLPDGTEVNIQNYQNAELKLTDVNLVYRLLDNRLSFEEYSEEENANFIRLDVLFRLKNGKNTYRSLYVEEEENLEIFNEIFHTEAYQKVTNQVMEDNFVDDFRIFQAQYNNGRMEYAIPAEQVRAVAEAYAQDVNNAVFSDLYYDIPIGQLILGGEGIQNPKYINEWRVPIYPSFTKTRALLKQSGILPEAVCSQEYLDSIKSISLYYDEEAESTETVVQNAYGERIEVAAEVTRKRIVLVPEDSRLTEANYEADTSLAGFFRLSQEEIKALLDPAYLQQLDTLDNYRYHSGEEVYEVIVERYTKEGSAEEAYADTKTYYGSGYYSDAYYLKESRVPEFLQEAIGKK